MRRTATALVSIAVVVAGYAAPGGHAAGKAPSCSPKGSRIIAATAKARVFEKRVMRDTHVRATYGCLLSRRRPVRFLVPDFPTGYDPIRLAGHFVAYGSYSDCAADYCDPNNVMVEDLSNGKRTFADGSDLEVANVTSLVLRANGSVAWIQTSFSKIGESLEGFTVAKAEHGKPAVVLATGEDVDPGSLALAGKTLYWTQAGMPASAPLG
jgi:hypothetical protein